MIYLDHNATTPVLPQVFESMQPYFLEHWGNPSSTYRFGSKLKASIENARCAVAELIGAQPRELIFTSGGTESNNSAIRSAIKANPSKKHIITSQVEHSSVLTYCKFLKTEGFRVTFLPVNQDGTLSVSELEEAISDDTAIVSLMWANNETGVLFPAEEIAKLCRDKRVLFHCDGVQAVGKLPINVSKVLPDYLSLSGHKINGPKGIGALFVRRKTPLTPFIYGGHQERGFRGGTENVPLIVGLGKAAELVDPTAMTYKRTVLPLRDKLEHSILSQIPRTELNGHKEQRLPNTLNVTFRGVESEALLLLLDQEGICASSGSACLADSSDPSHVLRAMKPSSTDSREMIRFSLGSNTSPVEIDLTITAVRKVIELLRP